MNLLPYCDEVAYLYHFITMAETFFWIFFLAAAIQDYLTEWVYDFLWCGAGLNAGFCYLMDAYRLESDEGARYMVYRSVGLLVFFLLQEVLALFMYGKADAYAFCCSALFLAARGGGRTLFTEHMLTTYLLLFGIQSIRKNLTKTGRLLKPVPFVPYIMFGLMIVYIVQELRFC